MMIMLKEFKMLYQHQNLRMLKQKLEKIMTNHKDLIERGLNGQVIFMLFHI